MAEHKRPNPDGVSREFDPRFSRAFQPGFDPRVHREAPPSAMLRDESVANRGVAGGADRDVGHGVGRSADRGGASKTSYGVGEAPMFAVPESDDRVSGDAAEGGVFDKEAEGDDSYPVAWWRRVNPWFIVLWVLGVAFIVAAFGLIQIVNSINESSGPGIYDNYFTSVMFQMVWIASPLLVVLGLATLTSTVVIQAVRWRSDA